VSAPSGRGPSKGAAGEGTKSRTNAGTSGRTKKAFHEERELVETYDARMLLRLWPFVRPHARLLGLSLAVLLVSAGLALARPIIMRRALDSFGLEGDAGVLFQSGVLVALLIVTEQVLAFPQMYSMQLAGARSMYDLRQAVFRFLHTRSLAFFDRTPVGRLVTRVTNDTDSIGEMFASGALNALGDVLRLVAIVVVLVSMDARLALIAFAATPPVALLVWWTRRRIRDAFRDIRVRTARMNAYLNEQIAGIAVVQAFAHEARAAAEFDTINRAYRAANNRSIVFDATLDAAIELVSSVCVAMVLWYAGVKAHAEVVSFGTLFAFVAYIEMFFVPIRDLSARYTLLQSAMAGAERVFELLDGRDEDAPEEGAADGQGRALERVVGAPALELEHVSFSYKAGTPVLTDVSLTVREGERVALVGATGAGKTTVTSLVLRLYAPDAGQIRLFGQRIDGLARASLRRAFAVVPQDVFLFPGTVLANVAAGDPEPSRERAREVLAHVGAWDLVSQKGGLDAVVLERGANFSTGERQLLAFARALYRDPPILILDEATASVDSDTEARLGRALEETLRQRTALIIAHRLSTVRAADRIVVFHRGSIAEQGTHDELLAAGGLYARLYELHFRQEGHAAAADGPPVGGG
jgi:ATP-binding cassette subfamily B multidrug efflux pump